MVEGQLRTGARTSPGCRSALWLFISLGLALILVGCAPSAAKLVEFLEQGGTGWVGYPVNREVTAAPDGFLTFYRPMTAFRWGGNILWALALTVTALWLFAMASLAFHGLWKHGPDRLRVGYAVAALAFGVVPGCGILWFARTNFVENVVTSSITFDLVERVVRLESEGWAEANNTNETIEMSALVIATKMIETTDEDGHTTYSHGVWIDGDDPYFHMLIAEFNFGGDADMVAMKLADFTSLELVDMR